MFLIERILKGSIALSIALSIAIAREALCVCTSINFSTVFSTVYHILWVCLDTNFFAKVTVCHCQYNPPGFPCTHLQSEGPVKHLVDTLLKMLEKDVIDNSKACAEYFEFFRSYASYVS